jgi:hypothetical protein
VSYKYIYIYKYIYVCVCVCVCMRAYGYTCMCRPQPNGKSARSGITKKKCTGRTQAKWKPPVALPVRAALATPHYRSSTAQYRAALLGLYCWCCAVPSPPCPPACSMPNASGLKQFGIPAMCVVCCINSLPSHSLRLSPLYNNNAGRTQ